MSIHKDLHRSQGNEPEAENSKEASETLKKSKDDPRVKQALKKEKQPQNMGDLSPVHNTTETGTSGGDQRATDAEINSAAESDAPPEKK